MQSADSQSQLPSDRWLAAQQQTLGDFADQIESCLLASDWDAMNAVLEDRHRFIRQLFTDSTPEPYRQELKRMAEAILVKDGEFLRRVEAEKHAIALQHGALKHSRRALKAYGE